MKKSDFVEKLSKKINQSKKATNDIVDNFVALIKQALKSGDEVVFPELGKFQLKKRAARAGINPLTQQRITVAARVVPTFKANKKFRESVVA